MPTIAELQSALTSALGQTIGSPIEIESLAQLPGGASQETWRLDLRVAEGAFRGEHKLVMRHHSGTKIFDEALDPEPEFRVLSAAYESGAPVPRPYWFLDDVLGHPALIMERLEGETIGRRIVKDANLAGARVGLAREMGRALASIHAVNVELSRLRDSIPSPKGITPAMVCIEQGERDLDRVGEPHPAIELALRWLRLREPPAPANLVLVHGDYRIGNFVVGPDGLRGVLDWEFAHIGDAAEDVAWGMVRDWRFGADGLRYGGVGQPEDFYAGYEEAGGASVDPARVQYWEVMGNVRWAIGALNQAQRHLRGVEPNLELASLGRRCAEMELEALRLISRS